MKKTLEERLKETNVPEDKTVLFIPIVHAVHFTAILVDRNAQYEEFINSKSATNQNPLEYEPTIEVVKDKFFNPDLMWKWEYLAHIKLLSKAWITLAPYGSLEYYMLN